MTSLKGRLTLELLKRKSQRKGLSQGFTLVELMIVIVIVGVLSAVALPSFLSQQNKAKLTEATSKISAILKTAHAEYQMDSSEDDAINAAVSAAEQSGTAGKFVYNPATIAGVTIDADDDLAPANVLIVAANPDGAADEDASLVTASTGIADGDIGYVYGCINLLTGQIDVDRNFKLTVNTDVDGTATGGANVSTLDCGGEAAEEE